LSTDPSELAAPDPTLSSDAADSTYEAAPAVEDVLPPPGPAVVQTLGKPGAGAAKTSKTTHKASSSSSSGS
jgi:hypothetical protein